MIRTSVPRERAHTLTVLVAFLITFFVMLGMLVSVCRAKAREAELEEAARVAVRLTRGLTLSGGESHLVYTGAYATMADARLGASRYANRGAAGYLYESDGAFLAVGSAYAAASDARAAAARLREQGIDAGVVSARFSGLSVTMTATDAQIDAFERGYRALTACEDALTDLAERLDADALTPANAKNECALAAYELKTARDDLTKAVGDHGERLTRGLSDRLDAARKTVSALTGGPADARYFASAVRTARLELFFAREAFLSNFSGG